MPRDAGPCIYIYMCVCVGTVHAVCIYIYTVVQARSNIIWCPVQEAWSSSDSSRTRV